MAGSGQDLKILFVIHMNRGQCVILGCLKLKTKISVWVDGVEIRSTGCAWEPEFKSPVPT